MVIVKEQQTFELAPHELQDAITTATARYLCKKAKPGSQNRNYGPRTEFELAYDGCAGELLVARELVVPGGYDRKVYWGNDNGIDGYLPRWPTISYDVKTNRYSNDQELCFYFDTLENFKADIMIGVQVFTWTRFRIVGYIKREEFEDNWHAENWGYGPRVACYAEQLYDFERLKGRAPSLAPKVASLPSPKV